MAVSSVTLPSGAKMPVVGLGTWKSEPGEVEAAVAAAIDCGYRHIDCAAAYLNEAEVGVAIKAKIDQGVVKREDLFITSKLWNSCHDLDYVRPAFTKTLKDLGIGYLDLYLIHYPVAYKPGGSLFPKDENGKTLYSDCHYMDTYREMEKLVEEGLLRDIGVSNFNSEQVQHVLDNCKIKPATNQVEVHPYFNNVKLVQFCHDRGVQITGYSPLGSKDRPWIRESEPYVLDDPKIKQIGEKYNKSPAQVVLRHLLKRKLIIIPKSANASRIVENFQLFDFDLTEDEDKVLSSFNTEFRVCPTYEVVDGKRLYMDHTAKHFPFNIEF